MNAEERAAFYQEISNRGILIFLRETNEEGTYCVSKSGTQADPRRAFMGEADIPVAPPGGEVLLYYSDEANPSPVPQAISFPNRDRAESYVKSQIGWDWKPEVLEQAPQIVVGPPVGRFSSFIMFDTGFGPQNLELGTIEADDPALAQSIAEGRAREHFTQYLPKEDFDSTKKSIRIRPLLP